MEDVNSTDGSDKPENAGSARVDYSLEFMQAMANNTGVGPSLVLSVKGNVIHGNLVGGRAFFEEQSRRVKAATVTVTNAEDDSVHEVLRGAVDAYGDAIGRFGERYRDLSAPREDADQDDDDDYLDYFHMNNAVIESGNGRLDVGWWRGRLDSVDGWTFAEPRP